MSLNDALHWRYAPKRMTGERVSQEQINAILKAAQYAPTSMGLQPFQLHLLQDEAFRKKIQPIAYNQPQIAESSHLLVFSAYTLLAPHHIDEYIQNIIDTRGVTKESLDLFYVSMMRFAKNHTSEQIQHWAANQTYIALGFALAEAALLGVDVTPMEGFDTAALDDLLGLSQQNLTSLAILAIGFRDEKNDFLSKEKKVRRSLDKLVQKI